MNPNCHTVTIVTLSQLECRKIGSSEKTFKWIGAYRRQLKKGGTGKTVPAIDVYGKYKNKITKSSRMNSKCASLLPDLLFFVIAYSSHRLIANLHFR